MHKFLKFYLSKLLAIIIGGVITLLCIHYSSYTGRALYLLVDYIFPAISGETINTTTTKGLTPAVHNLAFLFFAFMAGLTATMLSWGRPITNIKSGLFLAISFVALSLFSSVNFWPREQLIRVNAQALLDLLIAGYSLFVMRLIDRFDTDAGFVNYAKSTLIILLAVFGIALPITFGLVSAFAAFGLSLAGLYEAQLWLIIFAFSAAIIFIIKKLISNQQNI